MSNLKFTPQVNSFLIRALLNEMVKFGWISETRNPKERVMNLRKYFEVVELCLLENKQITRIACRRLAVTEKSDFALLAWAQEAKIQARNIQTSPGIVVGRLQNDGYIKHSMMNEFKEHYEIVV